MKQRKISILVQDKSGVVLFEKDVCSPQDLLSACALFERDGLKVIVTFNDVEVPSVPNIPQ